MTLTRCHVDRLVGVLGKTHWSREELVVELLRNLQREHGAPNPQISNGA